MYRKALALTLVGILLVGGAAIGYAAMTGRGLAQAIQMFADDHDHDD